MSPLPPRIAVVGGGLAGSLCSLVLRMRGARPVVIDAGRGSLGHGGALPDSGTQFLRAVDPRLRSMLAMLEREGLVAPWVAARPRPQAPTAGLPRTPTVSVRGIC
jgi:predicted NAD/FAD-dependent oxidoreductase